MNQTRERRVCGKECTTGVPRGNQGCSLFDSSLGEVHEVITLASDAPGSLLGELDKNHSRLKGTTHTWRMNFPFFEKKMASLSLLSLHLALFTKGSRC